MASSRTDVDMCYMEPLHDIVELSVEYSLLCHVSKLLVGVGVLTRNLRINGLAIRNTGYQHSGFMRIYQDDNAFR